MTKGQRIRQKREELNISQTDLANKINVSKQTLYKYENDIVTNIPSDKVEILAKELDTTPAFIMGWYEPPLVYETKEAFEKAWNDMGGGRHPIRLSDTEYTLIINYRAADPGIQDSVLKLLDVKKKEESNTLRA